MKLHDVPFFPCEQRYRWLHPQSTWVVAIDFGTTYSGFAFSFSDQIPIHTKKNWGENEERHGTLKTPTSILLRPNKDFDSFGYDADDKYVNFKHGEDKQYYYLKHFKMELHKRQVLFFLLP